MAQVPGPDRKSYFERANYYSSPDVEYLKTGKMTGTAGEDSARVIRENR